MGDRTPRDLRTRRDAVATMQPANLLGNVTRLLGDCGKLMDLYTDEEGDKPVDSEAFAMGVVYAALFVLGSRSTLPTSYIDAMRVIGVVK